MEKNQDSIYVQIMIESLEKKRGILQALIVLGKKQEAAFLEDSFDPGAFEQLLTEKDTYLKELEKVEDGFEKMYNRVKTFLNKDKETYQEQIKKAQKIITEITEESVSLEALENRIKSRITIYLNLERKEIKKTVLGKKIASNYYKNMSNQHQEGQSYFMDKKN